MKARGCRSFLLGGSRPFWIATALVTLFTWPIGIVMPGASLDYSWNAGLYMAVEEGRHFGTEVVFTYGPLGFLSWPTLWFGSAAVLAFFYTAVTYVGFVALLIWSLGRSVGLLAAGAIVVVTSLTFGFTGQLPLLIAVGLAFVALREDRPGAAMVLLALGGGLLCAVEVLVKLSIGPPSVLIVVLAMFGARADRRHWTAFLLIAIGGFFACWFATGQGLGNLGPYLGHGVEIVKGYGEAMGFDRGEAWETVVLVIASILLIAGIHRAGFRDTRARWFATAVTAVVTYASFKYGTTQFLRGGPPMVAMATLLAVFLMAPWPPRRSPLVLVATAVFAATVIHANPNPVSLDGFARVKIFKEAAEVAIRPGLRHGKLAEAREGLRATLAVPQPVLDAIGDRTVAIEPWEITVAWAYELNWLPLPVFQNYQDYTEGLDRLNAAVAEDADDGPEVLLRQTPGGTAVTGGRPPAFYRQPAWDPPEQSFADFCNFVPTLNEGAWQVLRRIPDRCGAPKLIASLEVDPGETFRIPRARADEVVTMRLHGAKIEGLEKLTSLFVRPSERHAVVDGGKYSYRLVPDTTEDPMIVAVDRTLGHGSELAELPPLHTMRLEGASGPFEVDFYRTALKSAG